MSSPSKTKRPDIGKYYRDNNGTVVEVRATCETHVVCDEERLFTRSHFQRRFMSNQTNKPQESHPCKQLSLTTNAL